MKLSQGEKITLITVFGAVIVTAIVHIGIREWYAPDVRYEEGSYYISGATAVTSLKLKNYGHSDAEDIIMTAKFNKPLIEISIDDRSLVFTNISGGKGQSYVSGKISRLVPGQEIFIYFAIKNSSAELPKNFLTQLTFKGGKGKTGLPLWNFLFTMVGLSLGYIFLFIFVDKLSQRRMPQHYDRIGEVIEMANRAFSEGISRDTFKSRLSGDLKGRIFRKETLQRIALRVFDSRKAEDDGD